MADEDTSPSGRIEKVAQAAVYMPFAYVQKRDESDPEVRTVHGWVSDSAKDLDGQRAQPDWLKKALGEWFPWGNIREMHRPNAVGTAISLHEEQGSWFLVSKIGDKDACRKIDLDIYKGYSIGIKDAILKFGDPTAPNGWIVGGTIVEVSIVDRPANPIAKFQTIEKALIWETEHDPVTIREAAREKPAELLAVEGHLAARTVLRKDITLADDLVPIDQGGTGTCDCEVGCDDCPEGCDDCGPDCNCPQLDKAAIPGTASMPSPSIAASLGLDELSDAQQFLLAAEIVRGAMIRELQETDSQDYGLGYHIESMGKCYDLLMELGRQEVYESGQDIINGMVAAVRGTSDKSASTDGSDSSQEEDEVALTDEELEKLAEKIVAKTAAINKAAEATHPYDGTHGHAHTDGDGGEHTHDHAHHDDSSHTGDGHAEPDADDKGATATEDKLASGQTVKSLSDMLDEKLAPIVARVNELYEQPADGGPVAMLAKRVGARGPQDDGRVDLLKKRLAELEDGANHDNPAVRAHRNAEAAGVRQELLKIGAPS